MAWTFYVYRGGGYVPTNVGRGTREERKTERREAERQKARLQKARIIILGVIAILALVLVPDSKVTNNKFQEITPTPTFTFVEKPDINNIQIRPPGGVRTIPGPTKTVTPKSSPKPSPTPTPTPRNCIVPGIICTPPGGN